LSNRSPLGRESYISSIRTHVEKLLWSLSRREFLTTAMHAGGAMLLIRPPTKVQRVGDTKGLELEVFYHGLAPI
jgi:hypothetical protein